MAHPYERLTAYRLAVSVADDLYERIRGWPQFERTTLGRQLMRSVDSIAANIAESSGRWHVAERRQFLRVARGSLVESYHWLERAEARGLMDAGPRERLSEAGRALNGLIKRRAPVLKAKS